MTEYAAGTVAVATVRGVPNVRVFRYEYHGALGWCSDAQVQGDTDHAEHVVTDVRPLIVLDLDDPNAYGCSAVVPDPAKIVSALRDTNSVAAHAIAGQIEAQTKPPRIPEPGLWGVVEAWTPGIPTRRWVHHEEDRWVCDTGYVARWEDLNEPVLVRPGVEDES